MNNHPTQQWQWALLFKVLHGPKFGHRIEIEVQKRGLTGVTFSGGTWTGLGIPAEVLEKVRAQLDAIVSDHLITRYGLREELPMKWSGEPDPF